MRKFIFITILLLFSCSAVVCGQISTREEPVSFKTNIPTLRVNENTQKILPYLDMPKIKKEDEEDEAKWRPTRFGYKHEVNYNLENSGEWIELSNGDKIWRLSIYCPEALSINLLYDKFWIPNGAKLFIYNDERNHHIGAFTSINNKGDKDDIQGFATGLVYGDQITLEYYVPNEVQDVGIISIAYVVHGYRYIVLPENMQSRGYGESGDCQVNVNCSEGQNWQKEKNAVALMLVEGIAWCTGSLINNTNNDLSPLFLTANHCFDFDLGSYNAINNPNLLYTSFYWHYEAPGCINSMPLINYSTVGATMIANSANSDFALLLLTEDPLNAPGVEPYYLGWDRSGNAGTGGVGIHHPKGDIKKISTYTATPTTSTCANSNYWDISFVQTTNGHSVMQNGSSGSSLINSNKKVIGQLLGPWWCPNIQCENPAAQIVAYGKFSVSWIGNNTTDPKRRLKDWLDPNNTGEVVLDGNCLVTTLINDNIIINKTINACGDINIKNVIVNGATLTLEAGRNINIQNVTVQNNGKLILDAGGEVNIISDFDVQLGSELEIR